MRRYRKEGNPFCYWCGNMEKITFIRKVARIGNRLVITMPRELHDKVKHGKYYRVILEPLEDAETQK